MDPLAKELLHVPTAPLVGAVDASHGFAEHVAAVKVPASAVKVPDRRLGYLQGPKHVVDVL